MRQTLSFQPVSSPYSLWLQMTQGLGAAGFPVTLCRIDHCGHKWQCRPEIPELFYFTAVWLGRKFLKCFHLKWGFPLELSCLPFIIMKQNSVDCAMGLSPNFLLNHLLVSIFFFQLVCKALQACLHVMDSAQNAGKNAESGIDACIYSTQTLLYECG